MTAPARYLAAQRPQLRRRPTRAEQLAQRLDAAYQRLQGARWLALHTRLLTAEQRRQLVADAEAQYLADLDAERI